jgi:predicted transcriptional regulator
MNRDIVARLRDTVPLRPLRYSEALRIAELHAQRFLAMSGVTEPSVPERVITELPRVRVARLSPFPTSGASHWAQGRWLVIVNGAEPATRQRFSLAHELKHIIDHRFVKLMYSNFPEEERATMVEQICDYFAGCLLMPRTWLKQAYGGGVQGLPDLARMFGVSRAAMSVRLSQVGLTEPVPRCLTTSDDWTYEALRKCPPTGLTYLRRAHTFT